MARPMCGLSEISELLVPPAVVDRLHGVVHG